MLFNIKADLDHVGNDLKMAMFSAVEGCNYCPCTIRLDDMPWYDMDQATAGWRLAIFTALSWQALRPGAGIALFRLLFVNNLTLSVDTMHVKHLGSDKYFYGSVWWLLCFEILDSSPAANCEYVFGLVKAFYKRNGYLCRKFAILVRHFWKFGTRTFVELQRILKR